MINLGALAGSPCPMSLVGLNLFPFTPFTCIAASLTVCGSIGLNADSMSIATSCSGFFSCSASVMLFMATAIACCVDLPGSNPL